MKAVIENCQNIDHAEITIEPCKLNVKFAPNGTGKTSIAKALATIGKKVDLADLVPFKWRQEGSADAHPCTINGIEDIKSVEVFDERYVQSVVFQEDALFSNSYDVFIRTPEFLATERNLRRQLNDLVLLAGSDEVVGMVKDLEFLLQGLMGNSELDNKNMPNGRSPIVKVLKSGNTWTGADPLLEPFKPLFRPGQLKKWVDWHRRGREYSAMLDDGCPYCGSAISCVHDRIDAVDDTFSSKASSIEKLVDAVATGGAYMHEESRAMLEAIVESRQPINDQQRGFIGKIVQDAQLVLTTLERLKNIASFFDLSRAESLEGLLSQCSLDLRLMDSFDSEKCRIVADEINRGIQAASVKIGDLKGLIGRQKSQLARSLRGKSAEINEYLTAAGYPYSVEITPGNDTCAVRLLHSCSWRVDETCSSLSYGERNAFALVFFAYDCGRTNPNLIILDDPISSFDGAKRFALLSLLFLGGVKEATLKSKTVLLLTHDYGTLFDIVHTHHDRFQPLARSYMLTDMGGRVSEVEVRKSDMLPVDKLYAALAKGEACMISRLVYARKWLELTRDKGTAYQVASSLFHHRPVPTNGHGEQLDAREMAKGLKRLEEIVGSSICYEGLLDTILRPEKMLQLFDEANSGFEKLQLARIAMQDRYKNIVIKERMDDSVHVGNGYIYQLDPSRYELVSRGVVEACRRELLKMTA